MPDQPELGSPAPCLRQASLLQPQVLLERVPNLPVSDELRAHVEQVLRSLVRATR